MSERQPRICLIDPNALSRARTTRVLSSQGINVTAVAGAADASTHAAARAFDIVVFDASLPMTDTYAQATLHGLDFSGFKLVLYSDRAPADMNRLARAHDATCVVPKDSAAVALFFALNQLVQSERRSPSAFAPHERSSSRQISFVQQRGWRMLRLLLIDDSELVLSIIQDRLKEGGFDVRIAIALGELESITRGWSPDVIVTDVNMPEMQGDDLCRRLKTQLGGSARVVLCSSLSDDELGQRARAAGADGFVSKRHGVAQIVARIREICESIADPLILNA